MEGLAEVLTALVAGPTPGVLIIDDLNRADDSSLSVIAYLAHRLRGRPILLLVTWRAEELADEVRTSADRRRRGRWACGPNRPGQARPSCGRGARDGFARARTRPGCPTPSTRNPRAFRCTSRRRSLLPIPVGGPTPGGVAALLRSRIGATGELARQLLTAAAVIGRSFELATVRLASGRSEDEAIAGLEELVRRGLIVEVGLNASGRRALRLQPRPAPRCGLRVDRARPPPAPPSASRGSPPIA